MGGQLDWRDVFHTSYVFLTNQIHSFKMAEKVTYERFLVFDQSYDFHRILIVINVFRQRR